VKRRRFLRMIGAALGAAAVAPVDDLVRAGRATEAEVLDQLQQPRGMVLSDGGVWSKDKSWVGIDLAHPRSRSFSVEFVCDVGAQAKFDISVAAADGQWRGYRQTGHVWEIVQS